MRSLIAILTFLVGICAHATTADSLTTIVDLEYKLTQKVKAILQPVDPDAIVVTKVEIKKTTTQMIGTQLTAIDIFATGDVQKIEDADIDEINVTVRSSLENFPPEISKIIENMIVGVSKKGRVQFLKMDAATTATIQKHKEYQKSQKESFQKLVDFAEIISKKVGLGLAVFAGVYTLVHLLLTVLGIVFQAKSANKLGSNIANIKVGSSEESARPMAMTGPAAPEARGGGFGEGGSVTLNGSGKDNPLEQMSGESLRALFSDAYWCENDRFAAWVWSCLSPHKKIDLLDAWAPFENYVTYLNRLEPAEDRFHLDPYYLKPHDYHQVANSDLLEAVTKNKALWTTLSLMRRQSLPLSLRERVSMSQQNNRDNPLDLVKNPLPKVVSKLRTLPLQIEIDSLTEADEELLMESPELIPSNMRRQLPSLVWVALLPREERESFLQKIPAQSLAEVWIGPEVTLQNIRDVLPEKKRDLLSEYVKKVSPRRDSEAMKMISQAAVEVYEKVAANAVTESAPSKAA